MVAQADAQTDHYSLQEDSDNECDRYDGSYRSLVVKKEEKEPGAPYLRTTSGMGPAPHVVAAHSSAQQGRCFSQPGDNTSFAGT